MNKHSHLRLHQIYNRHVLLYTIYFLWDETGAPRENPWRHREKSSVIIGFVARPSVLPWRRFRKGLLQGMVDAAHKDLISFFGEVHCIWQKYFLIKISQEWMFNNFTAKAANISCVCWRVFLSFLSFPGLLYRHACPSLMQEYAMVIAGNSAWSCINSFFIMDASSLADISPRSLPPAWMTKMSGGT